MAETLTIQQPVRKRSCGQRGMMLIMLLFMISLASTAFILHSINSAEVRNARDKETAQALQQAKTAIVSWSLMQTTPGKLPCPEDTAAIGTANEGQALGSCSNSLPSIGRLAWKTLGLGDLRDGNGDRLWYAISPGFRNTPINSDTTPQLTADGILAAAIVFSPGTPLGSQSRPVPTSSQPPDVAQYLDAPNNTGNQTAFVSGPQSSTFNDRLLAIKVDDFMPGVEKLALNAAKVALTTYYQNYSFFPFAATLGSSTSPNQCVSGNLRGLLPTQTSSCTCLSNFSNRNCTCGWSALTAVSYTRTGTTNYFGTSGSSAPTPPCQVRTTTLANDTCYCTAGGGNCKRAGLTTARFGCDASGQCTFYNTSNSGYFKLTSTQPLSLPYPNPGSNKCTVNSNVATCTFTANGQEGDFIVGDCSDPDITNNPATNNLPSWFLDNNWQNEIYYRVSTNCTSAGTGCTTATPQITVGTTTGVRALLISPGRPITATPYAIPKGAAQSARPSTDIRDYLDSTENTDGDTAFDAVNTHRTSNYNDQMSIAAP